MNIHVANVGHPSWTRDRVDLLTTLWLAGKSREECAKALGGFERSESGGTLAIREKIRRLGLCRKAVRPWTEERVNLLREIYQQGSLAWLAEQINKRTGSTFSRNAVVSKAASVGLIAAYPKRNDGTLTKALGVARRKPRRSDSNLGSAIAIAQLPKDVKSLKEYESKGAPKHFLAISFRDLEPAQCRYAYDVKGVTMFCGQPKLTSSSYCAQCHPMCWVPAPKRPRKTKAEFEVIARAMLKQGHQEAEV